MINKILKSARAESIPEGHSGYWFIHKRKVKTDTPSTHHGRDVICPAGTYTYLWRITDSGLAAGVPGDIVMEDTPFEIKTHMNFMLRANGNVLVTGLGLGCVVRGLLANPNVEHVTCIEKEKDVLDLVQPHMPTDRLTIIHADALEWTRKNKELFDFAWHDLWTCEESGEPSLSFWHAECLMNCRSRVKYQGAWAFPRSFQRFIKTKGVEPI